MIADLLRTEERERDKLRAALRCLRASTIPGERRRWRLAVRCACVAVRVARTSYLNACLNAQLERSITR